MFFRKRRLIELEGEVEMLREEVLRLNESKSRDIITIATLEGNVKRLEKSFVGFIKDKKELCEKVAELEAKVKELSTKKISETTTEEDEPVSVSQILDEYLNGDDEE